MSLWLEILLGLAALPFAIFAVYLIGVQIYAIVRLFVGD